MIDGVLITPLRQICDERGKVMHMLRCDEPHFTQFGEIYFSCVHPEKVKAWKLHRQMTLNCAVLQGNVKLVLYDARPDSETLGQVQEIIMGSDNYCLVTVPPLIWSGFTALGQDTAILANCATIPHSIDECERLDSKDPSIPYKWVLA